MFVCSAERLMDRIWQEFLKNNLHLAVSIKFRWFSVSLLKLLVVVLFLRLFAQLRAPSLFLLSSWSKGHLQLLQQRSAKACQTLAQDNFTSVTEKQSCQTHVNQNILSFLKVKRTTIIQLSTLPKSVLVILTRTHSRGLYFIKNVTKIPTYKLKSQTTSFHSLWTLLDQKRN